MSLLLRCHFATAPVCAPALEHYGVFAAGLSICLRHDVRRRAQAFSQAPERDPSDDIAYFSALRHYS